MEFTTADYSILKAIIDRNDRLKGMCKANGTTITEIIQKTNLSDKKIRITLKRFEEIGYIGRALKQGKATAYMLTKKGLYELKLTKSNVLGEVEK
ncbi:MAG: hypothetical protein ACRDD7_01710 [Peptostreptococcaceae bacterium]